MNFEIFVHKSEKIQEDDKVGRYSLCTLTHLTLTLNRELSSDTRTSDGPLAGYWARIRAAAFEFPSDICA